MAVAGFTLVGKEVITSDGRNIGQVEDLAIEVAAWKVRDLRVAIDKRIAEELGLQTRRGGVFLVKTESVKTVGDMVILALTMKALTEQASAARKAGDEEPFD